jgi:ERCC4-related helicase
VLALRFGEFYHFYHMLIRKQRVWFLAPTVALCEQQYRYIQSRLPDTSPLLLVGSSHLDYWSEQSIWDAALHNHRVVISTHAILLDAMQHGFVQLSSLALLVFDEGKSSCCLKWTELTLVQAHHCNGKHPANLIMELFYHKRKKDKGPDGVPHVLGLSASPVRGSNIQELQ